MCVAVERRDSIHTMKKWYGIMDFIFASATHWMPIPVNICWSLNERRSFRRTLASVLRLDSEKIIMLDIRMEMPAVMMKESRTCIHTH